jgi:hypothetical protein
LARFSRLQRPTIPPHAGPYLAFLLPFILLLALLADVLAFLFGGFARATVSFAALFAAGGCILGLVSGGRQAAVFLSLLMGATGLILGLVVGLLCGRIFRELPDQFD